MIRYSSRGGFDSFFARFSASLASPTMLIPGGQIRAGVALKQSIGRTAAGAAAGGATAIALQEAILQAAPNDRSMAETVMNVGLGTVFSGFAGGALQAVFSKEAQQLFSKGAAEGIEPKDAGAAFAKESLDEPEGLPLRAGLEPEGNLGVGRGFKKVSPILRQYYNTYSDEARNLMRSLDHGSVTFRDPETGRIVASSSVDSRSKLWEGAWQVANSKAKEVMNEYHGGLAGRVLQKDKLSRTEILEQASVAIRQGADFEAPEVVHKVAAEYRKFFDLTGKQLEEVGLVDEADIVKDGKYTPQIVRYNLTGEKKMHLENVYDEYFFEKLYQRVEGALIKAEQRKAKAEQTANDLTLDTAAADELREYMNGLIKEINDSLSNEQQKLVADIDEVGKAIRKTSDPEIRKELRAFQKEMRQRDVAVAQRYKAIEAVKARERNLNKGISGIKKKQAKAEADIRRMEAINLKEINNLSVKASTLIKRIDPPPKATEVNDLVARIDKAVNNANRTAERFPEMLGIKGTTRIEQLNEAGFVKAVAAGDIEIKGVKSVAALQDMIKSVERRIARLQRSPIPEDRLISPKYDPLRTGNKAVRRLKAEVKDLEADLKVLQGNLKEFAVPRGRSPLIAKLVDLNEARLRVIGRRAGRIRDRQRHLDELNPELAELEAERIRGVAEQQQRGLLERLQEQGISVSADGFDISRAARLLAKNVVQKQTSSAERMPFLMDIGKRGSELPRVLDIDPDRLWSNGYRQRDFMDQNVDHQARIHAKTVGPDIEIMREFGTLNIFESPQYQRIRADFDRARDEAVDNPKELNRIERVQQETAKDFAGSIERIRNIRGIAQDPASIGFRLGKVATNLNTLRFMGMVAVSSISDVSNFPLRFGFRSLFKDGFTALQSGLKGIEFARQEAKAANVGNDLLTHARLQAIADTFDELTYGTKAERGLQYATNKMGVVAGFDFWNAFWKQTAGVLGIVRAVRAVEEVVTQTGNVRQAENFLSNLGIDDAMADKIWKELTATPNGANRVNGVMLPNTGEWADGDVARAFNAGIVQLADDVIVTPGLERPLIMDGSMTGRILFQFRSFAFASITKSLVYSAQSLKQGRYMDVIPSIAMAIGLGMVNYWLWAKLAGGDHEKRMEQASPEKFFDEGLARSGILGPLHDLLNLGSKIHWLSPYVTASGEHHTKGYQPFQHPLLDLAGPTVSGVKDLGRVLSTIDDPNEITIKSMGHLTPYQNVWYLRPNRNQIEEGLVDWVE